MNPRPRKKLPLRVAGLCLLAGLLSSAAGMAQTADPLQRLDPAKFGPGALIEAMLELERYRPSQAVVLVQPLCSHPDPQVARTAGWLLRRMGNIAEGVSAASGALQNQATAVASRTSAAIALGELRSDSGIGALQAALSSDTDEGVRSQAALALGALHRSGVSGMLGTALQGDGNSAVRAAAARALGDAPDATASPLTQALSDPDPQVRREALWSIGRHRFANLLGILLGAMQNDKDCRVQAAAAWALGVLGDDSVKPALAAASQGICRMSSQAAAWALARLEGK